MFLVTRSGMTTTPTNRTARAKVHNKAFDGECTEWHWLGSSDMKYSRRGKSLAPSLISKSKLKRIMKNLTFSWEALISGSCKSCGQSAQRFLTALCKLLRWNNEWMLKIDEWMLKICISKTNSSHEQKHLPLRNNHELWKHGELVR